MLTERRAEYRRVEELRGKSADVSVRDRGLFEERNVPKAEDSLDRMRQWVRSVENSMVRREQSEVRENRNMMEFLR